MIEVLIALLLFSIASLGLATAQWRARQQGIEAEQYANATLLAADLLERMRSNPAHAAALTGHNLGAADPPAAADCRARDCTAPELALWDRREWLLMLRGTTLSEAEGEVSRVDGLPAARACVALYGARAHVGISWRGQSPAVEAMAPACGAGEGLYGDAEQLARSLVLRRFIGTAP